MTKTFDLNCAPLDQYPVIKKLTKSDMTTSQLVLPRLSVEEHIVRNMSEPLRDRLKEGDGRANIWVVDDENRIQHYLTMVDRDHRYSIISWGHVRASRELRAGQEMRFGWMDQKLHFIVRHEGLYESTAICCLPLDCPSDRIKPKCSISSLIGSRLRLDLDIQDFIA